MVRRELGIYWALTVCWTLSLTSQEFIQWFWEHGLCVSPITWLRCKSNMKFLRSYPPIYKIWCWWWGLVTCAVVCSLCDMDACLVLIIAMATQLSSLSAFNGWDTNVSNLQRRSWSPKRGVPVTKVTQLIRDRENPSVSDFKPSLQLCLLWLKFKDHDCILKPASLAEDPGVVDSLATIIFLCWTGMCTDRNSTSFLDLASRFHWAHSA